jgi:hypothetical protein
MVAQLLCDHKQTNRLSCVGHGPKSEHVGIGTLSMHIGQVWKVHGLSKWVPNPVEEHRHCMIVTLCHACEQHRKTSSSMQSSPIIVIATIIIAPPTIRLERQRMTAHAKNDSTAGAAGQQLGSTQAQHWPSWRCVVHGVLRPTVMTVSHMLILSVSFSGHTARKCLPAVRFLPNDTPW